MRALPTAIPGRHPRRWHGARWRRGTARGAESPPTRGRRDATAVVWRRAARARTRPARAAPLTARHPRARPKGRRKVTIELTPQSGYETVGAVTVLLGYRKGVLSLPGEKNAPAVKARVKARDARGAGVRQRSRLRAARRALQQRWHAGGAVARCRPRRVRRRAGGAGRRSELSRRVVRAGGRQTDRLRVQRQPALRGRQGGRDGDWMAGPTARDAISRARGDGRSDGVHRGRVRQRFVDQRLHPAHTQSGGEPADADRDGAAGDQHCRRHPNHGAAHGDQSTGHHRHGDHSTDAHVHRRGPRPPSTRPPRRCRSRPRCRFGPAPRPHRRPRRRRRRRPPSRAR